LQVWAWVQTPAPPNKKKEKYIAFKIKPENYPTSLPPTHLTSGDDTVQLFTTDQAQTLKTKANFQNRKWELLLTDRKTKDFSL
jgi:hypothetical protein